MREQAISSDPASSPFIQVCSLFIQIFMECLLLAGEMLRKKSETFIFTTKCWFFCPLDIGLYPPGQ